MEKRVAQLGTLGLLAGWAYLLIRAYPSKSSTGPEEDKAQPQAATRRKTPLSKPRPERRSPTRPRSIYTPRTVGDLKTWGRWATKTFGKKKLPKDILDGRLHKSALDATKWGVMPPMSEKEARRIAHRGERALSTFERLKADGKKTTDRIDMSTLEKFMA